MIPREHPTRLMAYLDGELESAETHRVAEHLADCEQCRAELDALGGLVARFEELAPLEAVDLWSGIDSRLPSDGPRVLGWPARLAPIAYGTAAAVALAAGSYLGSAALAPRDAATAPDLLAVSSLIAASEDALSRGYFDELLWEESTTDQEVGQ